MLGTIPAHAHGVGTAGSAGRRKGEVTVWGLVAGVLPIVASVWSYRQRLKLYAVICLVPGIAALLLGYWFTQVIDDSVSDSPTGPVEGLATPAIDEGGV